MVEVTQVISNRVHLGVGRGLKSIHFSDSYFVLPREETGSASKVLFISESSTSSPM